MAKKRMFRLDVLETDAFMEMPLTTQALYFHLNLRADDDGFVGNPNQIVKFIGASNDDFKLLIAKRFVLTFDDGVIVIKHWRMHNTLSKDRYHETKYIEDKAVLRLKDNKSYTFDANGKAIDDSKLIEMAQRQTKDEQKTTSDIDIDIDIDKDSNNKTAPKAVKVKHKHGEYQHVLLTDDEFNKLAADFGENLRDKAVAFLDEYIEEKGYKSKSHNLAIRRWVIDAVKKGERNGSTGKQNYSTGVQSQYSELDSIERLNRLG